MADLTKCYGEKVLVNEDLKTVLTGEKICPLREKCYRYTVGSDREWQSYWIIPLYNEEKKECFQFRDNGFKKKKSK